ncbi:hypothetical protein [Amorphus sp. 3PC139-8]|uniref:hypothetical protein n=1 Tax=Amorphus sp. 3PC139-8 TaxID=2735676 RepID=UPI00345D46ED
MVMVAQVARGMAWLGWAAAWLVAQLFYSVGDGFRWIARHCRRGSEACRRVAQSRENPRGAERGTRDRDPNNRTKS